MTAAKTKQEEASAGAETDVRRCRGRPQARPDEETRAILLEAARKEFVASGFAASSMESVARRAGVSTKTLYRLIPNKAALFEAMVADRIERFTAGVRFRACDGSDIEGALREALVVCGELILDPETIALQRMILAESDKFPEIAETFYKTAIQRTLATLANWLRIQHERGLIVVTDTTETAGMLLGMLVFQPQRDVHFGHKPPLSPAQIEQRARNCAALFLRGAQSSGTRLRED
jgi:AcrR family transcriptional regulator